MAVRARVSVSALVEPLVLVALALGLVICRPWMLTRKCDLKQYLHPGPSPPLTPTD